MSKDILWDVIIVGAGAAGLMTAIVCSEQGLKVLLLDGQDKIGLKILISGGTRCNVTNLEVTEKDFQSENLIYVRHILKAFQAELAQFIHHFLHLLEFLEQTVYIHHLSSAPFGNSKPTTSI